MKILYIIRGLPGSGKSTLAAELAPNNHYEADDYFVKNGKYTFDRTKLKDAHKFCQNQVEKAMKSNAEKIAVANTFVKKWEYEPYIKLAEKYHYLTILKVCTGNYQNIHNVSQDIIDRMRNNFEH